MNHTNCFSSIDSLRIHTAPWRNKEVILITGWRQMILNIETAIVESFIMFGSSRMPQMLAVTGCIAWFYYIHPGCIDISFNEPTCELIFECMRFLCGWSLMHWRMFSSNCIRLKLCQYFIKIDILLQYEPGRMLMLTNYFN